jgi:hypothetical protein
MAILDTLIMSACMGFSGQANDACQKAFTAGSKQTGLEQQANSYEQSRLQYLQAGAENFFGKDALTAIGGVGFVTKTVVERKASVGLPNFGLCNSLKFEFNSNTEKLVLQWRF